MNSLRAGISEYLELRRSLGFRLKKDERLLLDFADPTSALSAVPATEGRGKAGFFGGGLRVWC